MKILVVALLKPSQVRYKIIPLTRAEQVEEVIIIRRENGPPLEKVSYIVLPQICKITIFYLLLTPFIIAYQSRKRKVDLILSYHFVPHGFFAFLGSVMSGIPFIYSQIDQDVQNLFKNKLYKSVILHVLRKAKAINVPGSKSKDFWIKKGIKEDKINILHSTIDTENEFYPVDKHKKYEYIYVGTMEKRKQLDMILKALALLIKDPIVSEFRFCLVGEGEEVEKLRLLASSLYISDRVIFAGYQNNIIDWLNASKIFVMASRNEGIPCALMEAMSCELLPVAPNVADIADVINDGVTGILLEETTIERLYYAFRESLLKYNQLSEIRKNARQIIVEHHSFHSATLKWNEILERIRS